MSYLTKLKQFDNGIVNENRRLKSIYSKIVSESLGDDELEEELYNEDDIPEGGLEENIKLQQTKGSDFWTEENEEEVPLEEVDEGAPGELPKDLKVVSAAELFGERLFAEGDDDLEPEPGLAEEGNDAVSSMQKEYDKELGEGEEEAIIKIDEGGLPEDEDDPDEELEEAADLGMSPEEFFAQSPSTHAAPMNEEDERVPDPIREECDDTPVAEAGEIPFEEYLAQQEKAKGQVNEMYEDGNVTEGVNSSEEFLEVDDGVEDEEAPAETVAEHDSIDPLHDLGMEASFDEVEEDATPHMVDSSEITGGGSSDSSSSDSDTVTEKKKEDAGEEEPAEPVEEEPKEEEAPTEEAPAEEPPAEPVEEEPKEEEPKEEDEPKKKSKKSKKSKKDDKEEVEEGKKEDDPEEEEPKEEPKEEEPKEEPEEEEDGKKEIDESYSTLEDPNEDDELPKEVVESIKRNKRLFRK